MRRAYAVGSVEVMEEVITMEPLIPNSINLRAIIFAQKQALKRSTQTSSTTQVSRTKAQASAWSCPISYKSINSARLLNNSIN